MSELRAAASQHALPIDAMERQSTTARNPESSERAETRLVEPRLEGTWPHSLSHEPMLRVSDVLSLVQTEFPALTTSKLRFLDNNGLVTPFRTASGYRQYSPADVERLRFVLRQQRDQYQPLNIIAGHLESLDSGRMKMAVAPRLVAGEEEQYLSAADFAASASIEKSLVAELEAAGLISQDAPGRYDRAWLPLATAAESYLSAGGDLRTLKSLIGSARREANLAATVAQPDKMRGRAAEAEDSARDFAEASIAVFSACVRGQLSR